METSESVVKNLMNQIPQIGLVEAITIRKARRENPIQVSEAVLTKTGIEGDHFNSSHSDKRAVTLIQQEHLQAVGKMLNIENVRLEDTRRNIAISGINLLSLKDQKFSIGEAILQGTGYCYPCSRMEENFGPGGYNAMRGHGGITARVVQGGTINQGDPVKFIEDQP